MAVTADKVPTRRFGRTEIQMPVFSCGGMRYQQSWKDCAPEEIEADRQRTLADAIAQSLDYGINHIETARGYGTSEWQLGRVLPNYPREQLIVQTKIGPKDSADEFLEVFETSMQNLQLEYVDLLGVHGINTDALLEKTVRPDGMWTAIEELQRTQRIRRVGFSTHGPTNVIVSAIETGLFDYVNVHWYYVNPFTWPAIEAARCQDMGVFIISPNDKGGRLYEPSEKMTTLCAPLTPMQFNDQYCLRHPEVHTLSLGVAQASDFAEHVEGVEHVAQHPEWLAQAEERVWAALLETHGPEWMNLWHRGLPDWEDVPGHVNVFEILRLWTYATALDLTAWAKMRYNLLGQGDHWFPGQNAVDFNEKALDGLLKDHPFRQRIPAVLREAHAAFFEAPVERESRGG